MTFLRTNSGITNYKHFHDVEYLIYSEGGTYDTSLEHSKWAIDIIFWRSIFSKFLPDVKVKIRPMGSKENVLPYARKIASAEIGNSIAVMDRDHDFHRERLLLHPCIIYTYGYSWENDAWRAEFVISQLSKLSTNGEIPNLMAQHIRDKLLRFFSDFKRLIFVDILCSLARTQGIDREKYWSFVDTQDPSRYRVKKNRFKKLINDIKIKKTGAFKYTGNHNIIPDRDCYGKLLATFTYGIFCEHYKLITGCKNLSRESADQMIAAHIQNADLNLEPNIFEHYSKATQTLSSFLTK
jgi:hypothetical protein